MKPSKNYFLFVSIFFAQSDSVPALFPVGEKYEYWNRKEKRDSNSERKCNVENKKQLETEGGGFVDVNFKGEKIYLRKLIVLKVIVK
jgi:hypothetical protein